MKGRKPKAVAAKLLSGNPGKRTLDADSPSPFQRDEIPKPEYLDDYGSKEWDKLTERLALILSPADEGILLVACMAFSEMMRADELIRQEGQFYETENKAGGVMKRIHPAVSICKEARRVYQQALAELGATPVSHGRVKSLPSSKQMDLPGILRLLG